MNDQHPDDQELGRPPGVPPSTEAEAIVPNAATLGGAPQGRPGDPDAATLPPTGRSGDETVDLARPAALADEARGLVVTGYEVLGVLGRGGMGVVYKARQVGLNRTVALKMVLAGDLAGAEQLERFRDEAEAVARLQHPNIIQIHDIGERDGRPFFSLEFVEGGSLADRLDGTPWPPADAARLLETLARAIHEAHARGIVHRDLKPANVLLTSAGVPKVTDFGLAKRLDVDSGRTRSGAIMGTPSYMAPEQAGGKPGLVGPAADVYALGAILYELLTGRPPFKAATPLETVVQSATEEPVPPGRLVPGLPRDLETIALKCLQKDPARRFASAEALADDLHRYLAGEPIVARAVGPLERAAKWARRRPTVAALAATVVAVSAAGLAGILWGWRAAVVQRHAALVARGDAQVQAARAERSAQQARDNALRAEANAETARANARQARDNARQADENYRQARRAVADYLSRVTESKELRRPGLQPLRRSLLTDALKYYQNFLKQHAGDHSLLDEVIDAHFRAGQINTELGARREAVAAFGNAIRLIEAILRNHPDNDGLRSMLSRCYNNSGNSRLPIGQRREALADFKAAAAISERLVREHPDAPHYLIDFSIQLGNVARVAYDAGQLAEAERTFLRIRDPLEEALRSHVDDVDVNDRLASVLQELGNIQADTRRFGNARRSYLRVLELRERAARERPEDLEAQSQLARICNELGMFSETVRDDEEALKYYERSRDLRERLVRENPAVVEYQEYLARSCDNLGMFHLRHGRNADALPYQRRTCELRTRLARDFPDDLDAQSSLGGALHNMAMSLVGLGQAREAEAAFREAIDHQLKAFGREPQVLMYRRFLSNHYQSMGILLRQGGRAAEAAEFARRRRALWPGNPAETFHAACELAQCASAVGRGRPDPDLNESQRAERARIADEAMAALRQAVAAGLRDPAPLRHVADLAPLRDRPDFRALLSDLAFPADPFAR
jgi:serine/threonine-protein kinase